MRRTMLALGCAFALLPVIVFAASGDIPAGFATTSIFASKTSITAGDTVSLFSVLYNSSSDGLAADLVFTVDGTTVGTKHVSLGAGETQTPSVSWVSTIGSHTASAHLENVVSSSGEGASLLNAKADTVTLTVAPPLPPSQTAQVITSVASAIQSGIASSTPVVTGAAQKIYDSLEYLRGNAVRTLEGQLAPPVVASDTAARHPAVLGTSTSNVGVAGSRPGGVFGAAWQATVGALLYVCRIQVLFYALLLVVLFILYKLVRVLLSERAR